MTVDLRYASTESGRPMVRELRRESNSYMKTTMLVAPEKYEMTFRLRCSARCDSQTGLDRYLIDIGIGADVEFEKRHAEKFAEHLHFARQTINEQKPPSFNRKMATGQRSDLV